MCGAGLFKSRVPILISNRKLRLSYRRDVHILKNKIGIWKEASIKLVFKQEMAMKIYQNKTVPKVVHKIGYELLT